MRCCPTCFVSIMIVLVCCLSCCSNSDPTAVTARSLEIVDDNGRVRLKTAFSTDDDGGIFLLDNDGQVLTVVGMVGGEPGIYLNDRDETLRVSIQMVEDEDDEAQPVATLYDAEGTRRMRLALASAGRPEMVLYDAAGGRRGEFRLQSDESPGFALGAGQAVAVLQVDRNRTPELVLRDAEGRMAHLTPDNNTRTPPSDPDHGN